MYQVSDDRATISGNLADFIHRLRRKGVVLWMEDAGLRYRAPKGVLTLAERQTLSCANEEIVSLLDRFSRAQDRGSTVSRGAGARRAPLSFTQLAQWRDRLRYGGGRPIRNLASAFHLRGPLRVELLKESVAAVGRRHDALRTRIVLGEYMIPVQEVADKYRSELEVIPLSSLPETQRQLQVEHHIGGAILDAHDYAASPLFRAVLLAIGMSEHVLIIAMDHIISDLASLHLLSGEIITSYTQLLKGRPIDLPPVPVQFPDYAASLRARSPHAIETVWRRFAPVKRTRFPDDYRSLASVVGPAFGSVGFLIDSGLCNDLRAWARRNGTTIVVATLTAYAALLLRWCNVRETVIQFMTNGRATAELERTIGYLAHAIHVRVVLEENGTFIDLFRAVTEEYCRARDDADFGYSFAQDVRPEFTRNPAVNWLPAAAAEGSAATPELDVTLSRSVLDFSNMILQQAAECDDEEPGVRLSEENGAISGQVIYARHRFSDQRMETFAANITEFVAAMLRTPGRPIMDVKVK